MDNEEKLMRYIARITRCSNFYRAKMLSDVGLSGVQCPYLTRIARQPGISQDELARQLYKDKSVVARHLANLQQLGFIRREPSPTDRRVQQIYPTKKTDAILPRIIKVFADWEAGMTEGFTPEERKAAHSLLLRMYENAERVSDSLRETDETGKGGSAR